MKSSRNARVTSAEELGAMSKNNLREITLEIRPISEIHSHTLHPLLIISQSAPDGKSLKTVPRPGALCCGQMS